MKTTLAALLGALVGALAVWLLKLQPSVFMVRMPSDGVTSGSVAFLSKPDCQAALAKSDEKDKGECVAVDQNRAMVLALAAVSQIEPECNCDCTH